ncbi:molybdopterin converting factor subunit 1 [Aureimonas fodinaquatilis]|uniref:Molybdopterin converting factor subunit 1 n=1 Tax=Aureimonas fodinaquatilis TaxID=2565783 RepID=A0A5B0DTZ1_9HYPH|nr:molybdopterin converting factor subunit 1 [Aureimonas fodinaquatilis]KAA0970224.1 molybdopterin converting factor subunit 1 [Aureimonas fodinaquatilis]
MKLAYFASIRERIGVAEETVSLPAGVTTVSDLLRWLECRGDNYYHALQPGELVRVAIDHQHVQQDTPIAGATEIGFFPPMTGG